MLINLLLPLMGYLFGSISSAIIVSKMMGLKDPRTEGSGNPGATNVLRLGGKKAAIITLVGDLLKGLLPVIIAKAITSDPMVLALTALAAFLGHLYPVFFGFKGGKGVATAIGAIIGLSPASAGLLFLTWLAVAVISRYSSLAALTASAAAPIYAWWLGLPYQVILVFLLIAVMLFWRHRENIARLLAGTESKINLTKKST